MLLVAGVVSMSGGTANAIFTYAGPPGGGTYYENGDGTEDGYGTLGTEFISNITANVIQLGVYDCELDGFNNSIAVGLFDISGTLLVSTTLDAGPSGTLIGEYRYESVLAPISAGQSYVLAARYRGAHLGAVDYFRTYAPIDPQFTLVHDVYTGIAGSPLPFPTDVYLGTGYGWFGPNLRAEVPQVPEPGSLMLLGVGILGSGLEVWRRRRKS
jgi:hypothetical protein